MPIPSLKHVVIISPRSKTCVSDQDTYYGTLGRNLLAHLRYTLKMNTQEINQVKRFCLYGDLTECRRTYVDAIQQITGRTPFKPLRFENGSPHDLRQHLTELVEVGIEMLFIISATPFAWLTALRDDIPIASLPDKLPPLGALLVSRNGDRFELKPAFIPA